MRLTSWIIAELTHTIASPLATRSHHFRCVLLTFFTDEGVIAIVGVVRIPNGSATAIAKGAKIEFCHI